MDFCLLLPFKVAEPFFAGDATQMHEDKVRAAAVSRSDHKQANFPPRAVFPLGSTKNALKRGKMAFLYE